MLATDPPSRTIRITYKYSYKEGGSNYRLVSRNGSFLLGRVMAVLAECQHWLEAGLDLLPPGRRRPTSKPFDPSAHGQLDLMVNPEEPPDTGLDIYVQPTGWWGMRRLSAANLPSPPSGESESASEPLYEITLAWPIFENSFPLIP